MCQPARYFLCSICTPKIACCIRWVESSLEVPGYEEIGPTRHRQLSGSKPSAVASVGSQPSVSSLLSLPFRRNKCSRGPSERREKTCVRCEHRGPGGGEKRERCALPSKTPRFSPSRRGVRCISGSISHSINSKY